MHPYDIIFFGLSLDVVGAGVLAKSFMVKDPQDAYYEGLPVLGGNRALLKSAMVQRGEAWVGACLLLAGFLLQMWGNLHGGIAASQVGWVNSTPRMALVLGGTVALAVVLLRIARGLSDASFFRILFRNYSGQTEFTVPTDDPTWFDRMARLYDMKRLKGESDTAFVTRLNARRVELGKRYGGQASQFIVSE